MLLHASRDSLRNQFYDTAKHRFLVNDYYYCEAFGILRAMKAMGYATSGPDNEPGTYQEWLERLKREVLEEEGYGGNNQCDYCLEMHGKDGAGRKRR